MYCRRSLVSPFLASLVCPSAPFLIPIRARPALERVLLPLSVANSRRSYAKKPSPGARRAPESKSKFLRQVKKSQKSHRLPYQADSQYEASHYFRQLLGAERPENLKEVAQMYSAMVDSGSILSTDTYSIAQLVHTSYRRSIDKRRFLEPLLAFSAQVIDDLQNKRIPGHPAASLHLISFFKETREYSRGAEFWSWLVEQNEDHVDASVYGAAIELLAYNGVKLPILEELYSQALARFPGNFAEYHLSPLAIVQDRSQLTTLDGLPMTLLQGILTARVLHNDWRNAYLAFDTALRIFPTQVPSRFFELLIYERQLSEAYQIFLIACRSGVVLAPNRLTTLMDRIVEIQRHPEFTEAALSRHYSLLNRMMDLLQTYVGAGGSVVGQHLSVLVKGFSSLLSWLPSAQTGDIVDDANTRCWVMIRKCIHDFGSTGIIPVTSTYNSLVSAAGKARRSATIPIAVQDMVDNGMHPNAVTFRTALAAAGECGDLDVIKNYWTVVVSVSEEQGTPLDIKDWQALARAASRIGGEAIEFVEEQTSKLSHTITNDIQHAVRRALDASSHRGLANTNPNPNGSVDVSSVQLLLNQLVSRVYFIGDMVKSEKLVNFYQEPISLSFSTTPLSLGSEDMLRKVYDTLTTDPLQPPPTSSENTNVRPCAFSTTGYPLDELRFENWMSVNQLLVDAAHFEGTKEEAVEHAIATGKPLPKQQALETEVRSSPNTDTLEEAEARSLEEVQEWIYSLRNIAPPVAYSEYAAEPVTDWDEEDELRDEDYEQDEQGNGEEEPPRRGEA